MLQCLGRHFISKSIQKRVVNTLAFQPSTFELCSFKLQQLTTNTDCLHPNGSCVAQALANAYEQQFGQRPPPVQ